MSNWTKQQGSYEPAECHSFIAIFLHKMQNAFKVGSKFFTGSREFYKSFHNDASTALIIKIALKTFLDFVGQCRWTWKNQYLAA